MPETPSPDERLQQEFNRWAEAGEGEKMERHHLDITEKTIRLMDLRPGERVLDLGCGSGWATRLLARLVADGPEGFGQVVGVDVSDEMIRQARAASKDFENILYVWGSAEKIPWEENFFDKMLSVESFYYYPDQDRALAELFCVMAPERDFCEAAMVLLVLIFVGVVPTRLGHRQRTEQRQARHKAQPGFDCFAHKASSFWRIVQGLMGAHK